MIDFTISNHGSIALLTPVSERALAWCDEHILTEGNEVQRWCNSIVVEPRYLTDIIYGIANEEMEWRFE
jgi:hypothetical protein